MAKKQEDKAVGLVRDYHQVFGSEQGKRVLYDLMSKNNITGSSFVAGETDSTAFNEGSRNVILAILHMLQMSPSQMLERFEIGRKHEEQYDE